MHLRRTCFDMISISSKLLLSILILFTSYKKADAYQYSEFGGNGILPRPIMTLHSGHIGLADQLMITEYSGTVQTGQPYTLDIYMGNTDQYDYVIERCLYNNRVSFLDNYGCLRRDNVFLQKWETSDYTVPGALKRTLVHFVAGEPIVNFDCQVKVVECCGCAEASCERQPPLTYYPVYPVPLMCTWPGTPTQQGIPVGGGTTFGGGYYRGKNFWGGIPWWLWLIFLILFILLILLCCCGLCVLLARRNKAKNTTMLVKTSSGPPPPPPVAPKPKTEAIVQTVPETRQASQQVNLDTTRRQVSSHAAIPLTDVKSRQVIHTIYDEGLTRNDHYADSSPPDHYINFGADLEHDYEHERREHKRDYQKYGAVPVHRGNTLQQQYDLQSEIESRLQRDRERQKLEQRIETHLAEHRERHSHRHYEVDPTVETLREETIHTMRQTSAI